MCSIGTTGAPSRMVHDIPGFMDEDSTAFGTQTLKLLAAQARLPAIGPGRYVQCVAPELASVNSNCRRFFGDHGAPLHSLGISRRGEEETPGLTMIKATY